MNPQAGATPWGAERARRIRVALGEEPASLIVRDARVLDVLSGEIRRTDVVCAGEFVAALGQGYEGRREIDAAGRFVAPGLIDAHVHVESSSCVPTEFARALAVRGVLAAVADPHEIANVLGMAGISYVLEEAQRAAIDLFVMAPSCVPATHLETSGATLTADDLAALVDHPRVLGLAEVMNVPGTLGADPGVLAKLDLFAGRSIDGHAPALGGRSLAGYAAAGIGSDHESTTAAEALEKVRAGMTVFIREGSAAPNLAGVLPAVTPANAGRFCWCTDDRHAGDLVAQGSIDHLVRLAIGRGLDPMTAFRLATINPAQHFGLDRHGALAPGRYADLWLFDDLAAPRAQEVVRRGRLLAVDGHLVDDVGGAAEAGGTGGAPHGVGGRGVDGRREGGAGGRAEGGVGVGGRGEGSAEASLPPTLHVRIDPAALELPADPARPERPVRVIEVLPGDLVTGRAEVIPTLRDGRVVPDAGRDLAMLAVFDRHTASGRVGVGLIRGFGLRRGALAGTVAHDHHNLVAVGSSIAELAAAAEAVRDLGGGLAVVDGGRVVASLPLPVAGLMSDRPIEEVAAAQEACRAAARALGSPLEDPFMTLSFMALEVIPSLKLTDRGLVDVDRFELVGLFT